MDNTWLQTFFAFQPVICFLNTRFNLILKVDFSFGHLAIQILHNLKEKSKTWYFYHFPLLNVFQTIELFHKSIHRAQRKIDIKSKENSFFLFLYFLNHLYKVIVNVNLLRHKKSEKLHNPDLMMNKCQHFPWVCSSEYQPGKLIFIAILWRN